MDQSMQRRKFSALEKIKTSGLQLKSVAESNFMLLDLE